MCCSKFPLLLTAEQAAELCGVDLPTWAEWHQAEIVPAPHKVGKLRLWCQQDLTAWVRHGCMPRDEWTRRWQRIYEREAYP